MKILAWDQLLVAQIWTILMAMVDLTVYLKKVKMLYIFIMHNMSTTEVISVVNSLDKDEILRFLKHYCFFQNFSFP